MCLVRVHTYHVGRIGMIGTNTYVFEVEKTWCSRSREARVPVNDIQSFFKRYNETSVIARVVHNSIGNIKCIEKFILTADATKMFLLIKDQS